MCHDRASGSPSFELRVLASRGYSPQTKRKGLHLIEFRRGVDGMRWQKLWHFHDECREYPIKGFAIAQYRPSDENVCPQCTILAQMKRDPPQAG